MNLMPSVLDMPTTTKYGLLLPRQSDIYEVDDFNYNSVEIDTKFGLLDAEDLRLDTRITTEVARLDGRIDAEAATRASEDSSLSSRISTEAATRASADTALGGRIDSEATIRASADTALGSRIDSEATTRASNDNSLDSRINDIWDHLAGFDLGEGGTGIDLSGVNSRIDAEATTRGNADTELSGRIDAEAAARQNADTEIRNLDIFTLSGGTDSAVSGARFVAFMGAIVIPAGKSLYLRRLTYHEVNHSGAAGRVEINIGDKGNSLTSVTKYGAHIGSSGSYYVYQYTEDNRSSPSALYTNASSNDLLTAIRGWVVSGESANSHDGLMTVTAEFEIK